MSVDQQAHLYLNSSGLLQKIQFAGLNVHMSPLEQNIPISSKPVLPLTLLVLSGNWRSSKYYSYSFGFISPVRFLLFDAVIFRNVLRSSS